MSLPDVSLERRIAYLERRIREMELSLARSEMMPKRIEPLHSRLWRFTLNEDMGDTTSNEAAADLVSLDGTDTSKDVTVLDPLDLYGGLVNTDAGFCFEQLDVDGERHFVIIGNAQNKKQFCRFTTDAAFTTSSSSVQGDVATQFGTGEDHTTTNNVTFNNIADNSGSSYIFEGDSGDAGVALYSGSGTTW